MGRSGTSVTTAAFVAAGYYAGEADELMVPNRANPKGFYENLRIFDKNEALLASIGRSWFDAPTDEELAQLEGAPQEALLALLDDLAALAGDRPLVVKDPRIGVMLPIWWPLLEGRLQPVLAVRDPLEIALSLQRRDGTPTPFSLASWEVHMTGLLAWLAGRSVVVSPYQQIVAEPPLVVEVVSAATEQLDPAFTRAIDPALAVTAVDQSLHRNRASDALREESMTPSQMRLWQSLESLPAGRQTLEIPAGNRSLKTARAVASSEASRVNLQDAGEMAKHAGELRAQELTDLLNSTRAAYESELDEARRVWNELQAHIRVLEGREAGPAEARRAAEAELALSLVTIERQQRELEEAVAARGRIEGSQSWQWILRVRRLAFTVAGGDDTRRARVVKTLVLGGSARNA